MSILIENGIIVPMTGADRHFTGSVGIEGNRITMVTRNTETIEDFKIRNLEGLTVIDASGKAVMPGMVNTHTHAAMTLMRGYSDDVKLMDWLQNHIWPLEGKLTEDDVKLGTKLGIAEMLLGGTTSFLDMYHYQCGAAEAIRETGIRAAVSPFFLDFRMDLFREDFDKTMEIAKGTDRLKVFIAPHAPYTCSDESFRTGLDIAERYGLGIHIHLNETSNETPDYIKGHGESPVRHLEKMGLFSRPTVAAHCVYLDEEEMDILARHGVTAAHNPKSNMKLASGFARTAEMLKHGMNVSIGTDGAASNNNLDMWEEMRDACLIAKGLTQDPEAVPAYTALEMATVNGAKAIGMEDELGVIKKGALADVILVNLEGAPHHYPQHKNIYSSLVYSCRADDVDTTIVNGKVLVSGGKLLGTDICELGNKCTERLLEICNRK